MDLLRMREKLNMGFHLQDLKLRVTYYSRVSTDHLEQKKSLINQKEYFEKMIRENENWEYVDGYIDDGITGTSDIKRDNFMSMIEDAKRDKFDLIITKEISRFSRNTLDSIKYTRMLLSHGVGVLFLNDNINTILADSELRLTIMASMAQDEIRRLSERVKFGMHRAQQRGEILGNNMLYGYLKNLETGNLSIVEEEAEIVRRVYELYVIDDFSLSKISKILNAEQIGTRMHKNWSATTISRMIRNPKYKGYYCGRKAEVIDYMTKRIKHFTEEEWLVHEDCQRIPPIISEKMWNMANEKLKDKRRKLTKNSDDNIFNNKIYCSKHGRALYKRYFRRNKREITWICPEYLVHGKHSCDVPGIRESELYGIIDDLLMTTVFNADRVIDDLLKVYERVSTNSNILKVKMEDLERKKKKLLDYRLDDMITEKEYIEKRNALIEEFNVLEKTSADTMDCDAIRRTLRKEINSSIVRDEIIELIIEKILVNKLDDNSIELNIFINHVAGTNSEKWYNFKRGYDIGSTKRYEMQYLVKFIY